MALNTTSYLLDLPIEILDHITGYLNDEVLPTLRLTCRTLHGATLDRFCDVYIAHLGCWIISKGRWERLHNLLSASSSPLSDKVRTITLTLDELELRTARDFVSVSGYPHNRTYWSDYSRSLSQEQHRHAEHNIAIEAAAVEHYGAADLAVMLRVLKQARSHDCSIRLELAPANPLANKMAPLHPRAKEIQAQLHHAIVQAKPRMDVISLDRVRHMDLEDPLMGLEDEVREPFASLREFTLTPLMGDYHRRHKVKSFEIARTILTSAQHLRKLYLHVSSRLVGKGGCTYKRAQRWAPYLLLANGLGELESLTLLWVPLSLDDLLEILRRCSRTLTYLELRLDQKANGGESWWKLWEQLASMERLHHLKLERPQAWFPGMYYTYSARSEFVSRGEVREGLARLVDAEPSRE
jgi:anti-anti-sigma regulatory factor